MKHTLPLSAVAFALLGASDQANADDYLVLRQVPTPQPFMLTDCSTVTQLIQDTPSAQILGLTPNLSEQMGFSRMLWQESDHQLILSSNKTVFADPLKTTQLQYARITLADGQRPDDIDANTLNFTHGCTLIDKVVVTTTDLNLTTAPILAQWRSSDARQNQQDYDATTLDFLRGQYGYMGLGFGDYLSAGIGLHYPYSAVSDNRDSQISLHWRVEEALAGEADTIGIPDKVKIRFAHGWSSHCESISLRMSNDVNFDNPSIIVANVPDECGARPLFNLSDNTIPQNHESAILDFLQDADKLNHLTLPVNQDGQIQLCSRLDLLTQNGCSKQILASYEPLIRDFVKGEHDLFVQINFSDYVFKTYQLGAQDGSITEIDSMRFSEQLVTPVPPTLLVPDDPDPIDPDPIDPEPEEPEDTVEVLYLSTESTSIQSDVSDCSALTQAIETHSGDAMMGLEQIDLDKAQFASRLAQAENTTLAGSAGKLKITPIRTTRYQYRILSVDKTQWQQDRTLSVDPLSQSLTGYCDVPEEVQTLNAALTAKPAPQLTHWTSQDAADNARWYAQTQNDILRGLYGHDGLAFGQYAIAGLWYHYPRLITGDRYNRQEFALFWELEEVPSEHLIQELIPQSVTTEAITNWSHQCQPIRLQIATQADFSDASQAFGNAGTDCSTQPIFGPAHEQIPSVTSPAWPHFLAQVTRLHHITTQFDAYDQPIPCEPRDILSMEGCSQPILVDLSNKIKGFIKGQHPLYLQITFSGKVKVRFQLNPVSHQISVIGTELL